MQEHCSERNQPQAIEGGNMKFEAGYFRSRDGLDLFFRHWRPEQTGVGTFLVLHGLGEHSGRYSEFAASAVERGFEVYAMDHRGHGRSGGKRGHVDRFEQFVEDIRTFWLRFGSESEAATFLVGQSLGALIGLHYAHRYAEDLAGTVFCSGAFGLPERLPRFKVALGRFLRRFAPALTLSSNLDTECISADKEVIDEYLDDPYVHDRVSLSFFFEFEKAIQAAPQIADDLKLPALFLVGTEDCLVPLEGNRKLYERWSGPKEWKALEGQKHDLFHGTAAQATFDAILSWCQQITRPATEPAEERAE